VAPEGEDYCHLHRPQQPDGDRAVTVDIETVTSKGVESDAGKPAIDDAQEADKPAAADAKKVKPKSPPLDSPVAGLYVADDIKKVKATVDKSVADAAKLLSLASPADDIKKVQSTVDKSVADAAKLLSLASPVADLSEDKTASEAAKEVKPKEAKPTSEAAKEVKPKEVKPASEAAKDGNGVKMVDEKPNDAGEGSGGRK
jgi:hypothetical protein